MRYLPVAVIAGALLTVAVTAGLLAGPGSSGMLGFLGVIALILFLELPAVGWRMHGGSAGATWLVAMLCPLVPLEILLAISAYQQRGLGGDLQGIEEVLMTFVLPPLVLVTGSVVAGLACLVIRPRDEED
jgi:hypothetical protein